MKQVPWDTSHKNLRRFYLTRGLAYYSSVTEYGSFTFGKRHVHSIGLFSMFVS